MATNHVRHGRHEPFKETRRAYDRDQRKMFEAAVSERYQTCGYDLGWGERAPDDDTYVDVMVDLMAQGGSELDAENLAGWMALSPAEKRSICLAVGP